MSAVALQTAVSNACYRLPLGLASAKPFGLHRALSLKACQTIVRSPIYRSIQHLNPVVNFLQACHLTFGFGCEVRIVSASYCVCRKRSIKLRSLYKFLSILSSLHMAWAGPILEHWPNRDKRRVKDASII